METRKGEQNITDFRLTGFDTVKGIENTGGSLDFYQEMLFDFYRDYQDHAEKIKYHVDNAHPDEAGRCIHSLKGVSRTLGAIQLSELSEDIEEMIKLKDKIGFDGLYPVFRDELAEICRVISRFKADTLAENERGNPVSAKTTDEKLFQILSELSGFVKSGNYKAEKLALKLKKQYSDNQIGSLFDELYHAVEDLDASKAEKLISQIKIAIEGEEYTCQKPIKF
ncbi:MAG TPA: Hpt domain-containing protein [Thermotogota bacterium]|nr:Hpt domain-containing protein [Thermotogota bacterium]HPJ89356.1 Hpt domain-containing protein [Thermotogota bacterium]HPR96520.1 Hpt domain-containing protein [Thermotogota bacterium]